MNNVAFSFLLPSLSDGGLLQVAFFVVIVFCLVATVAWTWRTAKAESWSAKWHGGAGREALHELDTEHGSVSDLSQAVATASERTAEIMPGILLVLGLLGTFIGLGIALNEAAGALDNRNSAAGMEGAMGHLTQMVSGLGTKFKTSTWGIIAYLLIRGFNAFNGFEERRLRWCAQKMKEVLVERQRAAHQQEQQAAQRLITSVEQVGTSLCAAMLEQSKACQAQSEQLFKEQTELLRQQLAQAQSLAQMTQETGAALQSFVQSNKDNLDSMRGSSAQMALAAQEVGKSAAELREAVARFGQGVGETMDVMKKDLGGTIADMSARFSSSMGVISSKLADATTGIQQAVDGLSDRVGSIMTAMDKSITKSIDIQASANEAFLSTSESLEIKVSAMTTLVEKLGQEIKSGLTSVGAAATSMANLEKKNVQIAQSIERGAKAMEDVSSAMSGLKGFYDEAGKDRRSAQEARAGQVKSLERIERQLQSLEKHKGEERADMARTHGERSTVAALLKDILERLQALQERSSSAMDTWSQKATPSMVQANQDRATLIDMLKRIEGRLPPAAAQASPAPRGDVSAMPLPQA